MYPGLLQPFGHVQGFNPYGGVGGGQLGSFANQQMAMMVNLMGIMTCLLQQFGMNAMGAGSAMGSLLPAQAGFGGSPAGGIEDFLGSARGSGSRVGEASVADASGASAASSIGSTNIGRGSKVLEIGDSHTVGTFGHDLDSKLRSTGAQVATYASAGANPSDFVNGTGHSYGYWEKGADGKEKNVNYGTKAAPPNLETLIAREKPTMILVNLGANFRGSSNPKAEVDKIGRIAKKHNIPLVWVGPPKTAQDNGNSASIQKFDKAMSEAVAPYGKYIASSNFTPKYSGGDGIHYGGSEGTRISHQWADGVFKALTGK